MATRFNPANYDPTTDSSPGTEVYRPEPGAAEDSEESRGYVGVIIDLTSLDAPNDHLSPCACGCREPASKGSTFRPGHDARMKGILIRAHVTDSEVTFLEGGNAISGDAIGFAPRFNTERADWVAILKNAAAPRAPKAPKADAVVTGTVRVGRWEYPAFRDGDRVVRNTKRDGSGEPTEVSAKEAATFQAVA